jgi:hypothetical protein
MPKEQKHADEIQEMIRDLADAPDANIKFGRREGIGWVVSSAKPADPDQYKRILAIAENLRQHYDLKS